MSNKLYDEGVAAFKTNPELSTQELKRKHPLFRAGFTAAAKDATRLESVVPTKLYKVQRRDNERVYHATKADILYVLNRPRFRRLRNDHRLEPMLEHIIDECSQSLDMCGSQRDVANMVNMYFDGILQMGYDKGILSVQDCSQYDYTPYS